MQGFYILIDCAKHAPDCICEAPSPFGGSLHKRRLLLFEAAHIVKGMSDDSLPAEASLLVLTLYTQLLHHSGSRYTLPS